MSKSVQREVFQLTNIEDIKTAWQATLICDKGTEAFKMLDAYLQRHRLVPDTDDPMIDQIAVFSVADNNKEIKTGVIESLKYVGKLFEEDAELTLAANGLLGVLQNNNH